MKKDDAMASSTLVKIIALIALLFWISHTMAIHIFDFRIYYVDSGDLLKQAIDLVDRHQIPIVGNRIFGEFRLGPFANILAALPLLVSRDIRLLYYMISAFSILAVIIFFLTTRKAIDSRVFQLFAVCSFAFPCHIFFNRVIALNTQFLVLFVAIYFHLLLLDLRKSRWITTVSIWLCVGLCMQLNFSAFLLIPATLVALKPNFTKKAVFLHFVGLSLIALMHVQLILQIVEHLFSGSLQAVLFNEKTFLQIMAGYFSMLFRWLWLGPLHFGLGVALYGIVALVAWRRVRRHFPEYPSIFDAGILCLVLGLLLFPLLNAIKGEFVAHYILPALPFFAFMIGAFFHVIHSGKQVYGFQKHAKIHMIVFAALVIITQIGLFLAVAKSSDRYYSMLRLNDQIRIAEKARDLVVSSGLPSVSVIENAYEMRNASLVKRSSSPMTYHSLIRYIDPDMDERLDVDALHVLRVFVRPQSGDDLEIPSLSGSEAMEDFKTGRLRAQYYLGQKE